jgi:hypothetical protein
VSQYPVSGGPVFWSCPPTTQELRIPGQISNFLLSRPSPVREIGSGDALHRTQLAFGPDYGVRLPFGQPKKQNHRTPYLSKVTEKLIATQSLRQTL